MRNLDTTLAMLRKEKGLNHLEKCAGKREQIPFPLARLERAFIISDGLHACTAESMPVPFPRTGLLFFAICE